MQFSYVYILQSEREPEHFQVRLTGDLHDRLRHSPGKVPHTATYRPWHVKTAVDGHGRQQWTNAACTVSLGGTLCG
jgi:hypothetical protein